MNKKGIQPQLITVLVMMLIIIIFVVGYFIYSLIAPVGLNVISTATNTFQSAMPTSNNLANASNLTFGSVNRTLQNTEWITYGLLLAMLLAFGFTAYFVRTYPFFIIFWILFSIVLVFVSIFMSVSYENIKGSGGIITESYDQWQQNDLLIRFLPQIMVTFSIIGALVLFVIIPRNPDAEVPI
jgi:hypothetical protein